VGGGGGGWGWGWVGGVLDQMKIRLTQPSFTETGAWAELGNIGRWTQLAPRIGNLFTCLKKFFLQFV
jgi:hypothetical protein